MYQHQAVTKSSLLVASRFSALLLPRKQDPISGQFKSFHHKIKDFSQNSTIDN